VEVFSLPNDFQLLSSFVPHLCSSPPPNIFFWATGYPASNPPLQNSLDIGLHHSNSLREKPADGIA
jgi:hypothetical protein